MQVREQYRHFTVDEYQDVSPLQHRAARAVARRPRRPLRRRRREPDDLLVRGREPEYLLGFERRYEDADGRAARAQLPLDRRDRRHREPAHARPRRGAAARVARIEGDDRGRCTRRRRSSPRTTTSSPRRAGVAAADRAREIAAGAPPETIAVLYRVNAQSALLERALDDVGVAVARARRARFFDLPEVRAGGARAARSGAVTDRGRAPVQVGERRAALARLDACSRPRAGRGARPRGRRSTRSCASPRRRPRARRSGSSPTTCERGRRRSTSRRCGRDARDPALGEGPRVGPGAPRRAQRGAAADRLRARASTRSTRSAGCCTSASRGHGGGSS